MEGAPMAQNNAIASVLGPCTRPTARSDPPRPAQRAKPACPAQTLRSTNTDPADAVNPSGRAPERARRYKQAPYNKAIALRGHSGKDSNTSAHIRPHPVRLRHGQGSHGAVDGMSFAHALLTGTIYPTPCRAMPAASGNLPFGA